MTVPCQLCGEADHKPVSQRDRHGKPLSTVVCTGCGVITNDPIPTDEELAAFYRSDYRTDYKGAAEPRLRQVWRNFGRLETHIAANRDIYGGRVKCLDLGSGSGEFMYLARALGLDCIGIEPNIGYAAYSRDKLGLDVRMQTLEETDFPEGSFNLIRLSHVLEHMREPVRSLKVLRRWLKPDGVAYIEVPNIEAEAERKMRGSLFHYGHVFNFNPFTLRLAAGLAGLVEHPASRARHAAAAAGFFSPGETFREIPAGARENAMQMKAVLDGHNARVVPQPREGSALGRFASTLSTRFGEIVAARRFSGLRAIADHFARRVTAAGR